MGKIKYACIEKKKCNFSQQIVAIFFYCLIIEYGGTLNEGIMEEQYDKKNNDNGFTVCCSLWWSILFSL